MDQPRGCGGIGRRNGLKRNLSARRETGGAELLKFGEPCNMAIPSQALAGAIGSPVREGVETRRAAPEDREPYPGQGEGIVQTPNPGRTAGAAKAVVGYENPFLRKESEGSSPSARTRFSFALALRSRMIAGHHDTASA
jgi:hypothetical protein